MGIFFGLSVCLRDCSLPEGDNMKIINIEELAPSEKLSEPLYDPNTGELLISAGKRLSVRMVDTLKSLGFVRLLASFSDDEVRTMRRSIRFTKVPLLSIQPDTVMSNDLYDEEGRFLVAKGTKLSSSILSSLARRYVQTVYLQRGVDQEKMRAVFAFHTVVDDDNNLPQLPRVSFSSDEVIKDPKALNLRSVELMARQMEMAGKMDVEFDPAGGLRKHMKVVNPLHAREEHRKQEFVDVYTRLLRSTERLFETVARNAVVQSSHVVDMCDELISALVRDRELLLCSMFLPHDSRDYLAKHSLNTAIISINIATAHGYNQKMVMEVGYGALLADVGMLDVPAEIRGKRDKLSALEVNELKRHTIYGMTRLQQIGELPKTTALVAYQSHERLDGSGYPHRKRTHAIHDYAKIVAVSDVYHAMIDERPYRDGALIPYKAMEELLLMGSKNKLDRRFIRSLLAAVSLFPVASWVRLNTGEVARVLQAKEHVFTKPAVVILYGPSGEPCPPQRLDLEQTADREVVAAVRLENQDTLIGF